MKRQTWVVLTLIAALSTAGLATTDAQEAARPRSLVERLNALRAGWSTSSQETEQQPQQTQAPQAKQPTPPTASSRRTAVPARISAPSARVGRETPRVDPRSLLPRDFRGPESSTRNQPNITAAPIAKKPAKMSVASLGSIRSRILRDLQQNSDATVSDSPTASAAQARVGSVLSPAGDRDAGQIRSRISAAPLSSDFQRQPTTPATKALEQRAEREQAALSKSIAAEVAEQMAASNRDSEQAETMATDAAEPVVAAETSTAPDTSTTPDAAPVAEAVAAEVAEDETQAESPADTLTAQAEVVEIAPASDPIAVTNNTTPEPAVAAPIEPIVERIAEQAPVVSQEPAVEIVAVDTPTAETESLIEAAAPPITPNAVGPAPAAQGPTRISLSGGEATVAPAPPVVSLNDATDQAAMRSSFAGSRIDTEPTPAPAGAEFAGAAQADEGFERDDILITQTTPQVTAKVLGPRRVVIGQPARFQVHLNNRGAAAANRLATRVLVPEWAEVADITVTGGLIERSASNSQPVMWRMDRFGAGDAATMDLTLVAREGRPIELGVDWSHDPVLSRTLVEVQEPKLRMQISGPDDVYFGKPQLFRLTLSNPGTGVAENVALHLAPPGKPLEQAGRHELGDLRPGATKSIEIELTAREAGRLALLARADAEGGVRASVDKQLFCRKPQIEVDWRGPAQKYTGAQATYYFRVRNTGTAPAEALTFDVTLPEGFEMTSASEGQSYDSRRRLLRWRVGSLRPGDDYYMELKGVARTAGEKRLAARAETGDRLVDAGLTAVTSVVAVADLKLDILDPKGPLPVGADAVYEVRIKNRGSNVAESVDVLALFSGGIEPQSVEGHSCRIADGRVALPTIARLPAGAEVVLRVHARATEPGTHVFRAEVACRDLEIRLAAEEMTRFYADDSATSGAPRAAASRFSTPR